MEPMLFLFQIVSRSIDCKLIFIYYFFAVSCRPPQFMVLPLVPTYRVVCVHAHGWIEHKQAV